MSFKRSCHKVYCLCVEGPFLHAAGTRPLTLIFKINHFIARFFVSLFYLDWYAAARMTPSGFHQNQYLLSAMWGAARFRRCLMSRGIYEYDAFCFLNREDFVNTRRIRERRVIFTGYDRRCLRCTRDLISGRQCTQH